MLRPSLPGRTNYQVFVCADGKQRNVAMRIALNKTRKANRRRGCALKEKQPGECKLKNS